MKFLKIGNAILNIAQIECVTENLVTVGYVDNDDSPFGEAIREVKGIQDLHLAMASKYRKAVMMNNLAKVA